MGTAISVSQLLSTELKERGQILGPWLTRESVILLQGPRGVGKTFFALSAAFAASTASSFLKWKSQSKHRVIYFDGELGGAVLKKRLQATCDLSLVDKDHPDNLSFITPELTRGQIWNLAQLDEESLYTSESTAFDVIIIDNVTTCVRPIGREDYWDTWARVNAWARLMRSRGKCVVFIHHSDESRGVSPKEEPVDLVMNFEQVNDLIKLSFDKTRYIYGEDTKDIFISLTESKSGLTWGWTE